MKIKLILFLLFFPAILFSQEIWAPHFTVAGKLKANKVEADTVEASNFIGITPSPWTTSGSDIYYNTGSVGIGVASPSKALHIDLATEISSQAIFGPGITSVNLAVPGITISSSSGNSAIIMGIDLNNYCTMSWVDAGTDYFNIDAGTSRNLILQSSGGNLGIGLISPETRIHIETGSKTEGVRISNLGNDSLFLAPDTVNLNDIFIMTQNGYIGLGTNSPTSPLHIYNSSDNIVRIQGDNHAKISIDGTDGSEKTLTFSQGVGSDIWRLGMDNPPGINNDFIISDSNDPTASEFIIKETTGNIGFKTNNPSQDLHIEGQIMSLADVQHIITDAITLDSTQCMGGIITNAGDDDANIYTLPEAAIGFQITFILQVAQDIDVNPDDNDQILVETNAIGDAISSDAVIGSLIKLIATTDSTWMPINTVGTWTDVD